MTATPKGLRAEWRADNGVRLHWRVDDLAAVLSASWDVEAVSNYYSVSAAIGEKVYLDKSTLGR